MGLILRYFCRLKALPWALGLRSVGPAPLEGSPVSREAGFPPTLQCRKATTEYR